MSAPVKLEKAQLRQLDADLRNEVKRENWATLQFNPESLKVTHGEPWLQNMLQTGRD